MATVERPLSYDYHGYTVCKTGPWGQGPVFLQQLALLKGFDLGGMATDGFDGAPLRWNAERAWLYSVGDDLRDEGGREGSPTSDDTREPTYPLPWHT